MSEKEKTGLDSGPAGDDQMQDRKKPSRRFRKKVLDTRTVQIDFRKPEDLERFISKTGKILPRRMTGATARIQRKISREIKRARQINLLPIIKR
jgi:small subunit ribosomal protein S18